jgi:hypothetical protein
MAGPASFFSDPLDPVRSLQLNNRYWTTERFLHLDALREADEDIRRRRFVRLRRSLRWVTALLPVALHRAFVSRLAYSIAYHRAFEPVRLSVPLSSEFLEANQPRGDETEAFMPVRRTEEIDHLFEAMRAVHRTLYGRDRLRSIFEVRYINASNARRVREATRHGAFSDFHLDERGDFTSIVYLGATGRENGCFSYIDGTSVLPKSHLLAALHEVVAFDMQLDTPEQVAHLPLELRGGNALGNYLDDEKCQRLAAARVDVIGGAGDGIIFNGRHTLHRGGKPTAGERTALVISTSGWLHVGRNKAARQMLEYLLR